MPEMKLLLIAGRSLKQGTGLNFGKHSAEYREAVGTLEMNGGDMQQLGVKDGDEVKVTSAYGQTGVLCRKADLPPGMGFLAYGPASSDLMGTETGASGMPASKQIDVEVQAAGGGTHAG
jgi:formylmethanofuran dehydrogenase subunit D